MEEQLLNLMVKRELKELEDQKESILAKIQRNNETLKDFKKSILIEITSCTEPLIDNMQLLSKLEDIKLKIQSSSAELNLSVETMSEINQSRVVYEPVSKKGALFYMTLYGLKAIDPLYQFSMDSFVKLFSNSIDSASKDQSASKRISNVIDRLTNDIFEFSCIGIYEKHNLLFLFRIACALEKDAGKLLDSEMIFFIRGNDGSTNSLTNPTTWLSSKCWQDVIYLSMNFEPFSNLIEHFCSNLEVWKKVSQLICFYHFNRIFFFNNLKLVKLLISLYSNVFKYILH